MNCDKAGVKGIFTYEEPIIRLTIHLVKEKTDTFTFQFGVVEDTIENEPKTAGDAVSVPWIADEESAGTGSSLVLVPQTFGPFAGYFLDSLVDNVAEEDVLEKDLHKNLNESDPAGDAELSDSLLVDTVSAGYSSVSLPKYSSSVIISSLAIISSRYLPVSSSTASTMEIKYQEFGIVMKTENFSDPWPPDLIQKTKQWKFDFIKNEIMLCIKVLNLVTSC
jgi:hypothetical protein